MPPKKTELQNTEKRLAETRDKLVRIQTGQHNVRGKEKRVEVLQKSIADLELKVSALQNAASILPSAQSAGSSTCMRIIHSVLGAPATDGTITPVYVKPEQLESTLPLNGPGSEQHPMQIDCDSLDVVMSGPQMPLSAGLRPANPEPLGIGQSGSEMTTDSMTGPPNFELTNNGEGVQDHNMGCSIDAVGPQAVKSTNDFVTAQDVGTAMAPVVKTTSSDGNNPSIVQEPNMDMNATGSETDCGIIIGRDPLTCNAVPVVSRAVESFHFPSGLQEHTDLGINTIGLQAGPNIQDHHALFSYGVDPTGSQAVESLNPGYYHRTLGPQTLVNNDPTSFHIWQGNGEEFRPNNGSLHDLLASKGNVGLVDDGFANDWVWDPQCDVDENIYSFHLQKYDPGNDPIDKMTVNTFDSEKLATDLRRQEWENQRAVVEHYEQQVKELTSKQQSLFRSLSRGFNGDMKCTVMHVTAITRACHDIETVERHIRDHSVRTKAKRYDYLASLIEVDQHILMDAQEEHKGAYERLANIDPLEISGIQTEQGLIRLSKERIDLLQKDIESRVHEMKELADVARRFRDEGSEDVSEGTVVVKPSASGKGKKRMKEESPAIEGVVPKHRRLPSVQAAIDQESQLRMTEDVNNSSSDAKDAMKSLQMYLKNPEDPKLFRFKFRKQAREQVNYFPDASFTSVDVSKLVFKSSQQQALCEYHRKGKGSTFKADTLIELFGMGFKGESVSDSKQVAEAPEGHLHCGCPTREVALEFFLWKTTRAFSSNPKLSGRSYTMEDLSKLKPSTRAFWNKSIRDYTGLQVEDLLSSDYGTNRFAVRIALAQLHTQMERLRALRAPVVIKLIFPAADSGSIPDDLLHYGMEADLDFFGMSKELEHYWAELKAKRKVLPLPLIPTTRED